MCDKITCDVDKLGKVALKSHQNGEKQKHDLVSFNRETFISSDNM